MAFLTWKSITTPDQRKALRWVFRRNVINPTTVKMISEVIDKKKISDAKKGTSGGSKIMQAPTWPGFVVKEGEEGFTALVGSPNVSGVAWLIIQ